LDVQGVEPSPDKRTADLILYRALGRARLTILWERLWPGLASIATALGLFLALSWLGIWLWLPALARAIGLILFLVLAAAAILPLARLRWPSIFDGLRRLDRVTGLQHRPATAIADQLATNADDPVGQVLWRAHVERAILAAKNLKVGLPVPRLALFDPLAVRAFVLVLVIATFFAAGGERGKRIAAAFDWQGGATRGGGDCGADRQYARGSRHRQGRS
jgi:hypothetical protein